MSYEFKISPRTNGGDEFFVEADSHAEAASIGARKMFGKRYIVGLRQTGEPSGSGMFQAYVNSRGDTKSSHGKLFHVAKIND